ncbi:LuxR C-terminal-related transcriptional regulator [Kitasatospora sp. NPDC049258]|uniref:ATP-binding protein n=1 Tax=Kitasatospora sp. NPDC049258 TaxID=3155394 RepID=UPI00341EEC17
MGADVLTAGAFGLPAEVDRFVGRRGELAAVVGLLSRSRLVTLIGPGGVGKTRLALRVAADVGGSFEGGMCLVELAQLRDPLLVAQSVVDALDVEDHSGRTPEEVLARFLAERRFLLVLDNCEHLAVPCARLLEGLLRAALGLKVLATSRQRLAVPGEHVFVVPPMRAPVEERFPGLRALRQFEAVALFEQRAAAVLPGFAVTEANAGTVARLVAALDGIPLAIELAASWLRVLTLDAVLSRLTDRSTLLDTEAAGARPDRQTLREMMDWSFELCSPQERLLWARVSVFSGGFDLAAAEAVCSGNGIPKSAVLQLVAGLVDKSVLSRQENAGGVRFRLLETIREYGDDHLTPPAERARLRRRHRDHFKGLLEQLRGHWFGAEQVAWFTRIRAEHANLRAALEFSTAEPGEAAVGLAMIVESIDYWNALSAQSEARQWLRRLLAVAGDAGAVRTQAMSVDVYLAVVQGRTTEAWPLLAALQERAERLGDDEQIAWAVHHRAMATGFENPGPAAVPAFEEALALHRARNDLRAVANTQVNLSITDSLAGNPERALALSREVVALTESRGETYQRSYAISAEALAVWMAGDRAAADALLREAIRLKQPFRDRWGLALCVELAFWNATQDGAHERAAHLIGILQGLWAGLGGTMQESAPFMVGPHEAFEAQVRAALGGRVFQAAVERGARLSPDQVIADLLREEPAQVTGDPHAVRLTRRERQVAELIAQGMSNKNISAALVISLRTTENHVEHVLAKLGFTSRTQVALWVSQQEALPAGSTADKEA